MMLLPDRGVGLVVLANNGMTPIFAPHMLGALVDQRATDAAFLPS